MNNETLLEAIGGIDEDLLARSESCAVSYRPLQRIAMVAAAGACVVFLWFIGGLTPVTSTTNLLISSETTLAESPALQASDYFRDCEPYPDTVIVSDSGSILAGKENREYKNFSNLREELENSGILPIMEGYEEFDCTVIYEDGELFCVLLNWGHRGTREEYSNLSVIIAPDAVTFPIDHVAICVDEDGNVIEPSQTITERDGIQIAGTLEPSGARTLTFHANQAWFRIAGSFNDSAESVVALLDWFWEHPVTLDLFY